jgi:cytochrome bd-type quinol oxidase subunit 2
MREPNAEAEPSNRVTGVGRLLIVVYGILALAATGRSATQLIERFHEAPVAYLLSALSAVVYILATVALVFRSRGWYRVAWGTIGFELAGVLIIGTVSVLWPSLLGQGAIDPFGRQSTVWSAYGMGYLFIPLVLPVLGMWWLARHRPTPEDVAEPQPADAA